MADVAEQTSFTDAATAISQGKRHLLVRDYTAAVTAFAEGLRLLSQEHGDCGDELGEPYLLYGRALLGLAREEAGVLGGGVPGSEEAEDEDAEDEEGEGEGEEDKLSNIDEKEEENDDEEEDTEPSSTEPVKPTEETDHDKLDNENAKKKTEEKKSEENVVAGSSKDEASTNGDNLATETNGNVPSGSGEEEGEDVNKEDDDEDNGRGIDLQVAWEVLELAKIVFHKRGPAGIKQLAEAHRLLGEVAMESGNHQVAIADLEQALKILKEIEPNASRSMAELHYQLGLANSLLNEFDSSIEQFKEAASLLETRIKELEETKEPPKTDDPFYTIEGEIDELKELLPEIQEKITDMKDFKQEQCQMVIEGIKNKVVGSCTNGAGPSSSTSDGAGTTTSTASVTASSSSSETVSPKQTKPASDISHLVRKKRKADEPEIDNPSPCKKPTP